MVAFLGHEYILGEKRLAASPLPPQTNQPPKNYLLISGCSVRRGIWSGWVMAGALCMCMCLYLDCLNIGRPFMS